MTERTRFTISVEPEVYEAFADLAYSSGVSLSRCIGDWLRDTAEAAQMTTIRVNEVRKSPQDALQAFLRDAIVPGMQAISQSKLTASGAARDALLRASGSGGVGALPPRPVIRGGKSPEKGKRGRS